ncbi:MAG: class I SAM-dependent methyltransferase [Candidatus Electrothrix sp. ATG2]|nr:class I SAM-dependent methyltransferase [Candidatus Electrothrix sp. ATG2]
MNGVLDRLYSQGRHQRPEYVFRYKTRSLLVRYAVNNFLNMSSGQHLLDLGAADGLNLLEFNALLEGDWIISGIEYSSELLAEAPDLPSNISLDRGDITQPLAEQEWRRYDIVTALAVLEHLQHPVNAVKNATEALKNGGIFVATSPVPFWDKLSSRLGLLKGGQHECDMNSKALIGCLEAAGLTVEECGKFMWAPISFLPYLKVRVSPARSMYFDALIRKCRIFNFLFVNQYVIGRKVGDVAVSNLNNI